MAEMVATTRDQEQNSNLGGGARELQRSDLAGCIPKNNPRKQTRGYRTVHEIQEEKDRKEQNKNRDSMPNSHLVMPLPLIISPAELSQSPAAVDGDTC